jgi:hypothetical protein
MSKSLIPSRGLLSSFSRCLQTERKSRLSAVQCRNLFTSNISTSTYTPLTRIPVGMRGIGQKGERMGERGLSTSSRRAYKTVEEQRSRYRSGVCLPFFQPPLPLHHATDRLGDPTKPISQTLYLTLIRNFSLAFPS